MLVLLYPRGQPLIFWRPDLRRAHPVPSGLRGVVPSSAWKKCVRIYNTRFPKLNDGTCEIEPVMLSCASNDVGVRVCLPKLKNGKCEIGPVMLSWYVKLCRRAYVFAKVKERYV